MEWVLLPVQVARGVLHVGSGSESSRRALLVDVAGLRNADRLLVAGVLAKAGLAQGREGVVVAGPRSSLL